MKSSSQPTAVKRGSVTVWIYHTPGRTYDGWTLVYYAANGTRQRLFRSKLEDAKVKAEEVATQMANLECRRLTSAEIAEHDAALKRLNGSASLLQAVDYFCQHHDNTVVNKPVADALTEFLESLKQDNASHRHYLSLKNRLTLFVETFSSFAECAATALEDWLRTRQTKLQWTGRTRNHYRAALSNFLNYAKRRKYLPASWSEIEKVPKAREDDGEIGIYTPSELQKVLAACADKDLLPFILFGAFAGMRPSEIERLKWEDIHQESSEIFIGLGKVRTAGHRVTPILPNLKEFLTATTKCTGPVSPVHDSYHALQAVFESAQVERIPDGFRHSYISYRRAVTKNLPQVSGEVGTDPKTLTKRYCRPVSLKDAEGWFSVVP